MKRETVLLISAGIIVTIVLAAGLLPVMAYVETYGVPWAAKQVVTPSTPNQTAAIPGKLELVGPASAHLWLLDSNAEIGPAGDWSTPIAATFNGKPVYRIDGLCRVKGVTKTRIFYIRQEQPWIVVNMS